TVTMPESIVHKLIKSVVYPNEQHESWIKSEKFQVHYLKPIITKPDGSERSTWPEVFPLSFFKEQEHTREYKKNYLNLPVSGDEEYWSESDFIYGEVGDTDRVLLQIDPAVTSKRESDQTAFAVIAFQKGHTDIDSERGLVQVPARCEVREVRGYRLPPERLRQEALAMLVRYPEIGCIRIEVNQGGDTW